MKKLVAVLACYCLLIPLLLPPSLAQKTDLSQQKREAVRRTTQPAETATVNLEDAVNSKQAGKGQAQSNTQSAGATTVATAQSKNLSTSQAQQQGVAESVVASGQGVAGRGTASAREATGPVYKEVPPLTRAQAEAMAEELEEINPVIRVPEGSGKKILQTQIDPPTSPVQVGRLPTANVVNTLQKAVANELQPLASNDFIYSTVRDIPVGAALQRSTVGEPSIGNLGNTVFYTGNWYAARSADGGATFTYVNPSTTFPSINGGFCCDQLANHAAAQDMMLWALQYRKDSTSGTLRLARSIGSAGVINNQWRYYDFNPQNFGFDSGTWMDFPGLTISSTYAYLSSNVFNNSDRFVGSVVWRVPLAELAAGGSINYNYFKRTDDGAPRLTEGATTTMYWATHVNTSTIRIFRWDDSAGSVFWNDVSINPYAYLSRDGVARSPDGTNWAARCDSRVLGAWVANGVIGFMWGAKQDSTFPYPYTIIARFNQGTRALISQNNIWSSQTAWLYPAASVNAAGNLAGLLIYGGGPYYPGTNIWISDDVQNGFNPLALNGASASNTGPTRNSWGDYHTVHPSQSNPNTWVAATYYMQDGGDDSSTVPRYLWFGRERDFTCSFSISPTGQSFGSNGGTGSVNATASTPACSRTANSNVDWLRITSGGSGTGSGTVNYSVDANTSSAARTGTMTIAGRTFTVTQSGSACTFSISPSSASVSAAGATGSVGVTTSAGCAWTANSNVSWISITAGSTGTGSGTVNYSVAANSASSSRSGTLSVAGQTFTVTQAAAGGGCPSTPIAIGQTLNGTLSVSDCRLSDGSYFDGYTFSASSGQQIVLTMSSTTFDTYLFLLAPNGSVLTTNDDGGGGTNSRIPPGTDVFTLPAAGTYTILANSFAPNTFGGYTLSLASGTQCTPININTGQTVSGALSTDSCRLTDGSYYNTYAFNGTAGQQVTIEMLSSQFDTFLFLLAPDGSVLAVDDDGGAGTNSRIPSDSGTLALPTTGKYSILANSYAPNVTGTYSLSLSGATSSSTVRFGLTSYTVSEGQAFATITVTRTGDLSGAATVKYATGDSTDANFRCNPTTPGQVTGVASRKCDYHIAVGRLRFAAGESVKQFSLSIINDVYVEGAETFNLTLSNPVGATLDSNSTVPVTITDDDAPGAANPIDNTTFYVRQLYVDLLSREPDPAGWSGWTNRINLCGQPNQPPPPCDRVTVGGDGFLRSGEFFDRQFFVLRLYRTGLGRILRYDDVGDLAFVSGFLTAEQLELNKQDLVAEVMSRSEFASIYNGLNNTQFVDTLLQTAAITAPADVRLAWINSLNNSSKTRAQVYREISERAEVSNKYLHEAQVVSAYYGFFTRNPDGAYLSYLQRLDSGEINLGDLANAFINAAEYRSRFGQ